LESGGLDELVDRGLECRREAGDVLVPDKEAAGVSDLLPLPLEQFLDRVL
jgi:hypothetical protein